MNYDKIAAILADRLSIDQSSISRDSTFEGMGLDSLDIVELVMEVEEAFGVTIELSPSVKSVGDLEDIINGGN